MSRNTNLSKLKTSWTKYDIVQVMDVIDSLESIESYKKKEIVIDEPILKSFLGIKTLRSPTPPHWIEVQKYPAEKKLFAFLAVMFTHYEVVKLFAEHYSQKPMGGTFKMEHGKMFTNIRSALVESGATLSNYRRHNEVPFDFSMIFGNGAVGVLFKEVLKERLNRVDDVASDADFYRLCYENGFDKALGLSSDQFKQWLEGSAVQGGIEGNYIDQVEVRNFHSIEEAKLELAGSKEVYLLGENGDGKSLVLMAIYLAFRGQYILDETDLGKTGAVVTLMRNTSDLELRGVDDAGREYGPGKHAALPNFYAYGTHRGRFAYDNNPPEQYGFMSLFDINETLSNPVAWLLTQKAIDLEKQLDHHIVSEHKPYPVHFSVPFLENVLHELLEKNVQVKIDVSSVRFIEKGHSLTLEQLSEGYRSILIFVVDLMVRLTQGVEKQVELKDLKGVVLIDEIDQHLHPKWQRVVIRKLRTIFPQVQFIMTTHSPTIIQGAGDDAIIYRVYRDSEDGNTRISEPYCRSELDHLMINSLVTHPLFGLEDARMNPSDDGADTSDSYLLYRVNKKIEKLLDEQKRRGKRFISDNEVDDLIEKIMKEELGE